MSSIDSKQMITGKSFEYALLMQFEEKLKELNCKDVKGEIEKIKQIPKRAKEEKKKILREFNIGNDIKKIAQRLSYCRKY